MQTLKNRGPFKCDYCQTGFCTFQGSISDHETVHEQKNLEIPIYYVMSDWGPSEIDMRHDISIPTIVFVNSKVLISDHEC